MIDVLLPAVLVVGLVTLAVGVLTLRSTRRSEELGEGRYEFLRDQHNRLEVLREERQVLVDELKRESQERQQFTELLGEEIRSRLVEGLAQAREGSIEHARRTEEQERERLQLEEKLQQLNEELERERQGHLEAQRRIEGLEQEGGERSRIEQQAEQVAHDLQQLRVAFEREREGRLEAQRLAEQLDKERLRLDRRLSRSKEGSGSGRPEAHPWWRKPISVVALLLGSFILWLTSLVVALNLLTP
jgi:DNA repair exonuclease SbcCD ATPase subunit